MPSSHIRKGNAWKNGYSNYKSTGRYEKNRKRDLEKHLEAHPNDEVAKGTKIKYRRKKPLNKNGWTYSAFKTMDKKFRAEHCVTKSQCKFWAMANKLRRATEGEMQSMSKKERESFNREMKRERKNG